MKITYKQLHGLIYRDSALKEELAEIRPDWFKKGRQGRQNKDILLKMAKDGKPKPARKTDKNLREALNRFTNPHCEYHDPEFTKEIKSIRPDWFKKTNREILLQMAKDGKPKPIGTNLWKSLTSFMNPNCLSYDPIFTKDIKNINPEWFKKESHKETLMQMAKEGKPRPTNKTNKNLYQLLMNYTNPNDKYYDPTFAEEIEKIRPEWLKRKSNRKILLRMAKEGKQKPTNKTNKNLYLSLMSYINPNRLSYDPIFTDEMKNINPGWLERQIPNKEILLKMAKDGKPTPTQKTNRSLYASFMGYTNPNNEHYDLEFTKEMKRIRPYWRKSIKKEALIKIAKEGKPRPTRKTNKSLYQLFMNYTNPNNGHYDPEFTQEIENIRPEWLERQSHYWIYKKSS